MGRKKTDEIPTLEVRERYLAANGPMTCDGCGDDKAITKGVTYLEHTAEDGHRMVFCQRCIFAIKAREAATREPFEVKPGDLVQEKLPHRSQAAWQRLRERFTKSVKVLKIDKDEAWRDACNKLMDELGMRHLYERDVLLSRQAEKFEAEREKVKKEAAALLKRVKKLKRDMAKAVDNIEKERLRLLHDIAQTGSAAEGLDALLARIKELRGILEQI